MIFAKYGGQAAGTAIADVLFGDYNPAGRLPVTFYASDNDLPSFTDYSMGNRTYRYFKGKPQYAFGYGLSYSDFTYSGLDAPLTVKKGGELLVRVQVSNNSKKDGEEVTELYISHTGLKQKTAIRSLKGFERTLIKAGETKEITFKIPADDLSITDSNGDLVSTPGKLEVSVGGSQPDEKSISSKKTVSKVIEII